jgi:hypothetical protein
MRKIPLDPKVKIDFSYWKWGENHHLWQEAWEEASANGARIILNQIAEEQVLITVGTKEGEDEEEFFVSLGPFMLTFKRSELELDPDGEDQWVGFFTPEINNHWQIEDEEEE